MARILVLTTDLPYFPGKNGHDFFNLRHLAGSHEVAVVAPCYEWFPRQGVAELEKFVSKIYGWPRPSSPVPLFVAEDTEGLLPPWIERLPAFVRRWGLRRILRVHRSPGDAYEKLSILSNCAPHLLEALSSGHWHAIALIQTSSGPWLDYLPAAGGKMVYFHDVRSDYLKRSVPLPGQPKLPAAEIQAVFDQEKAITKRVDVVGFVSNLDLTRAHRLFDIAAESGVAPIPVDTEYFHPAPEGWNPDARPVVLFTGHLSHPPNVDAILHFLEKTWPLVKEKAPRAAFIVAGMLPAPEIERVIRAHPDCELHPNVPDIRPFFWNARVYVVPMRFGGGVRQKLFEAWAMKIPVVCTTMAAEGTGAINGTHCWMENTAKGFASRVVDLLESTGRSQCTVAAKEYVEAQNSLPAAAPQFRQLIDRTVSAKRRRPYKLLFDLRWMELGKAGGVEQATFELLAAIAQYDHRNQYRIHAPRSACLEWDFPRGFQCQYHFSDLVEKGLESERAFLANRLAESLGVRPVLTPPLRSLAAYRELDFDLVHSICSYTHPDLLAFPGILTIHDLQHLHHPEFFSAPECQERETLYRTAAQRAKHIICISEFTRQDVHRQYGVPLDKMTTIWNIPSRNVWVPIAPNDCAAWLRGMGVETPFIFYPAQCWPHKNHVRLVETFRLIIPHLPADLKLVFTGRPFPPDHPAAQLIRESNLESRVVHLGYRSPLEIRALFQSCLLLVFPSLFEGFGMPVAEAIIAGKPVACSNLTSLPEIAGEAALTFDPTNIHDMGGRILEIVNNPALRTALSNASVRRRNSFAARRSAVQTLAVYQRVYDELYHI